MWRLLHISLLYEVVGHTYKQKHWYFVTNSKIYIHNEKEKSKIIVLCICDKTGKINVIAKFAKN